MKRKQYTMEQIIGFLKAQEAGAKIADLTCKHGFSEQSSIAGSRSKAGWKSPTPSG